MRYREKHFDGICSSFSEIPKKILISENAFKKYNLCQEKPFIDILAD